MVNNNLAIFSSLLLIFLFMLRGLIRRNLDLIFLISLPLFSNSCSSTASSFFKAHTSFPKLLFADTIASKSRQCEVFTTESVGIVHALVSCIVLA